MTGSRFKGSLRRVDASVTIGAPTSVIMDIAKTVSRIRFRRPGFLPLGSWGLNVYATHDHYLASVARLFEGTFQRTAPTRAQQVEACLYLIGCPPHSPAFDAVFRSAALPRSAEILVSETLDSGILRLSSWMLRTVIDSRTRPARILCFVRDQESHRYYFRHFVHAFFLKLMRVFDRFYLHASGVHYRGRTSIFVGKRHAGKTTVGLRLAREGARLLSDDHVVLKKRGNALYASGCRDTARISWKTETFLWGEKGALEARPKSYGGLLKKEFRAGQYFDHVPYRDFELHTMFFVRRGERIRIEPLTKEAAILKLLRSMEGAYPFHRREDYIDCLEYLRCVVEHRSLFDVELGRDLRELDTLVDFLRNA